MFDGLWPPVGRTSAARVELDPLDPINRGLLRFLPLGESGGRVLDDIGPRRARGALVGTVDRRASAMGRGLYFTGGSYASISSGRIVSGLNAWTISLRFRAPGSGDRVLYCERGPSGGNIVKMQTSGGQILIVMRDDASTLILDGSFWSSANDGNWHHVAIIKNGGFVTSYYDGKLDRNTAWGGTNNFTESGVDSRIGTDPADGGINYTGEVADLRLFNLPKSQSDVIRLSASRFAGTLDPATRLFFAVGVESTSHDFTAASIASASTVGTPALGQVHALGATGIASASSVGTPALGQVHALGATGVASASTVGAPALAQVHAFGATGIAAASSVGTPILNASPSATRTLVLPARDRARSLATRSRGLTLPARDRAVTLPPERT